MKKAIVKTVVILAGVVIALGLLNRCVRNKYWGQVEAGRLNGLVPLLCEYGRIHGRLPMDWAEFTVWFHKTYPDESATEEGFARRLTLVRTGNVSEIITNKIIVTVVDPRFKYYEPHLNEFLIACLCATDQIYQADVQTNMNSPVASKIGVTH